MLTFPVYVYRKIKVAVFVYQKHAEEKIINNVASVINHASFMVNIHKIYMMIKLPNHSMYEMQNIATIFRFTV